MEAIRIKKIAEEAGITACQLRYWGKTGLVCPSVKGAAGKGSAWLYSEEDAVAARAVGELRRSGASLQKIRRAVELLEKRMPGKSTLAECSLTTDGRNVFVSEDSRLTDVSSKEQLELPLIRRR